MNDNTCICCGAQIPEGRQICPICEKGENKMNVPKPCPFCGKEPTVFRDNYDRVAIMCENCALYFGIELECEEELVDGWRARIKSIEEAVKMWNRRVSNEKK